jgi:TRAP-type C4-dicarboxylate transport system substrate-binding protein
VAPYRQIWALPYLLKTSEEFYKFAYGPVGIEVGDEIERAGLKFITWVSAGERGLAMRSKCITNPESMKGMKIRVMANPIEAKIWSTFGGIPTSMPTGEVYSALQVGAIDGGENSPSVIESFKYNEPAPHVALTEHQYSIAPLIMSEKRFNAMNPELQKVFMDVIRETCQYQRKRDAELVAESLERMKTKGTKITQPDKAKFAALAAPIQEEVAKNLKVEDLLALVRSHAR